MHYQEGCTQVTLGSRLGPDIHCQLPHAEARRELLTTRRSRGLLARYTVCREA
jgi:hypothetical protein